MIKFLNGLIGIAAKLIGLYLLFFLSMTMVGQLNAHIYG